jgi:hypothetical protein
MEDSRPCEVIDLNCVCFGSGYQKHSYLALPLGPSQF